MSKEFLVGGIEREVHHKSGELLEDHLTLFNIVGNFQVYIHVYLFMTYRIPCFKCRESLSQYFIYCLAYFGYYVLFSILFSL